MDIMTSMETILKNIEYLENVKKNLEMSLKGVDELVTMHSRLLTESYKKFYDEKRNKEFVLYEDYPSLSLLEYFLQCNQSFPMYQFGLFHVKELAEIIKYVYQFKTGQEFRICTVGKIEYDSRNCPYDAFLYFLIGSCETLLKYQEYDGTLASSLEFCHSEAEENLVKIPLDRNYRTPLGIKCETQKNWGIVKPTFLDSIEAASLYKQVFGKRMDILSTLQASHSDGIQNVLSFSVHSNDVEIANILISIAIYKRNNQKEFLAEEDYHHIFETLYGEKVDILGDVEKDFSRTLVYVPNMK